jgi:hypothetical protein
MIITSTYDTFKQKISHGSDLVFSTTNNGKIERVAVLSSNPATIWEFTDPPTVAVFKSNLTTVILLEVNKIVP